MIFTAVSADSDLHEMSGVPSSNALDSTGLFQFPIGSHVSLVPRQSDDLPVDSSIMDAAIRVDQHGEVLLELFERSGIGLAILDPTMRVQAVNQAFTVQCGRTCDEVHDRAFLELLHPSVRQYLARQFARLMHGQQARMVGRAVAVWAGDSESAAAGKLAAFPVGDGKGRIKMILVLVTPDRTETKRALVSSQWKLTSLTARVLEGVAAGEPTVRLAAKLFLSRQGIEYHVSILLRQFKVPNRAALAAKAYSMGMFSIGCWPPKVLPEYVRSDRPASSVDRIPATAGR